MARLPMAQRPRYFVRRSTTSQNIALVTAYRATNDRTMRAQTANPGMISSLPEPAWTNYLAKSPGVLSREPRAMFILLSLLENRLVTNDHTSNHYDARPNDAESPPHPMVISCKRLKVDSRM